MNANERKILYGVCGIGMGHTLRQQPIIDHLVASHRVVIFAYGDSYRHFSARYSGAPNVTVLPVSVPFFVGGAQGLDFAGTALRADNFAEDTLAANPLAINCAAMARAQELLGRPDVVITDYEPVSAQYAYSQGAPLVTIDQQSKYLTGSFPTMLHGQGFLDEVQRLRMFFPKATARFACSFFKVQPAGRGKGFDAHGFSAAGSKAPSRNSPTSRAERVQVIPPVLSGSVLGMRRGTAGGGKDILVYISSQREFSLTAGELAHILASQPGWRFHVFLPQAMLPTGSPASAAPAGSLASIAPAGAGAPNVSLYAVGDARYGGILERCAGIVSTAGHSLLSEAMHLRKPVYALPLAVYEQQMNAHVIDSNGFGIARPHLTEPQLAEFLGALPDFAANIRKDRKVLLRGSSHERIIRYLERSFLA